MCSDSLIGFKTFWHAFVCNHVLCVLCPPGREHSSYRRYVRSHKNPHCSSETASIVHTITKAFVPWLNTNFQKGFGKLKIPSWVPCLGVSRMCCIHTSVLNESETIEEVNPAVVQSLLACCRMFCRLMLLHAPVLVQPCGPEG